VETGTTIKALKATQLLIVVSLASGCVAPIRTRPLDPIVWEGLTEIPGSEQAVVSSVLNLNADATLVTTDQSPVRGLLLSLEDAIRVALRGNRTLADAQDATLAAQYSIALAESEFELKIFPLLRAGLSPDDSGGTDQDYGFSVDLVKRLSTGTDIRVGPVVERLGDTHTSAVRASIRQPLLRGRNSAANRSGVMSAEYSERTRRRLLHTARIRVVAGTVAAVYEVIRQREFLRLNENSANRLRGDVAAAKARQKAGLGGPIDVFRASLQLGQAQDNLTFVREAHEDALDTLRLLLGIPIGTAITVSAPLEYNLIRLDEHEAIAISLEQRMEVAQAEDNLRESSRLELVAKHNTLPTLDLHLNYSRIGIGDSLGDSSNLDDGVFGFSLVTSSDISRTTERILHERARLDIEIARRGLIDVQERVARQVKQQLRNLQRTESRIDIQHSQVGQAQGKLELARLKFRRGLTSNFDVIEAEAELRRAQTTLVSAVIDYVIGAYTLRAALGTLIEP